MCCCGSCARGLRLHFLRVDEGHRPLRVGAYFMRIAYWGVVRVAPVVYVFIFAGRWRHRPLRVGAYFVRIAYWCVVGDDALHRPECTLHRITFRVDEGIDPYKLRKPYAIGNGVSGWVSTPIDCKTVCHRGFAPTKYKKTAPRNNPKEHFLRIFSHSILN